MKQVANILGTLIVERTVQQVGPTSYIMHAYPYV